MVNLWISASLLGLTGWQGYRLGREYGWWGRAMVAVPGNNQNEGADASPLSADTDVGVGGLGHSKTDFDRLLTGFSTGSNILAGAGQPVNAEVETDREIESVDDEPMIEPNTTLMRMAGAEAADEYPDETDQVPDTCNWMDDEDEPLEQEGTPGDDRVEEPVIMLDDYVKRVKTVQRKMTQLVQKRQSDSGFMKHELGVLIQTYQLDNDQSLAWLFQQHGEDRDTDYGSVFDRIERLAA